MFSEIAEDIMVTESKISHIKFKHFVPETTSSESQ